MGKHTFKLMRMQLVTLATARLPTLLGFDLSSVLLL